MGRTWAVPLIATALYWVWESRAAGNIRVDLLLIYPALFAVYLGSFWPRFRFWSLPMAAAGMVLNVVYFVMSYRWFDKYPG